MKKILFSIICIFLLPCFIYASCDNDKHDRLLSEAKYITQSTNYSTSLNKFDITFDNISNEMYIVYNGKTYKPNNGKVNIDNISEGSNFKASIFGNDGCSNELDIIRISIPYHNSYYNSALCSGYENILTMCNSEFTSSKTTKELILKAIDNYNNSYSNEKDEVINVVDEETLLDKTIIFGKKWGPKIVMVLISGGITLLIGSILYRKEKHGI